VFTAVTTALSEGSAPYSRVIGLILAVSFLRQERFAIFVPVTGTDCPFWPFIPVKYYQSNKNSGVVALIVTEAMLVQLENA
jgi:hypothetical protein